MDAGDQIGNQNPHAGSGDDDGKTGFGLATALIGITIFALLATIYVAELVSPYVSEPDDSEWMAEYSGHQDAGCLAPKSGVEQQMVVNRPAVPQSETTSE